METKIAGQFIPQDLLKKADDNTGAHGRVMMLGLRGIPNVQGGVEKHTEMLATELVDQGWDVEVIARTPYVAADCPRLWQGVRLRVFWSPRHAALEALVHTFIGVCYAAIRRPDILHIHAIGPALLVPLARLLGLNVVVTHHGYDYDRQKWGWLAKKALRWGEKLGMRFSHGAIAVSNDIATAMKKRHSARVNFVPNGVSVMTAPADTDMLTDLKITPRGYILLAARIVPEKRQMDLIEAYDRMKRSDIKLVLVGNAEFDSPYAKQVRQRAAATPGVVLAGFQTGPSLAALFSHAGLFVLPSSHEGMPIALLEAMAHGLPVLASDIVANKQLGLPAGDYFPLGDIDALARALAIKLAEPPSEAVRHAQAARVARIYSWTSIAAQTAAIYRAVLVGHPIPAAEPNKP